ncbi:MAG: transcriptional repressor [Clostridia bacterium]|nr:transcriptional repressor [Clostridia bacterium]
MKNYSRQREAILSVISSTDTHPTADWIYTEVRKLIPNISLGTVYRNLADLRQSGMVLSVDVGDGKEHFDYDTSPHLHLSCKACGKIIDARLKSDPIASLSEDYGFVPEIPVYVVRGYCAACKSNSLNPQ